MKLYFICVMITAIAFLIYGGIVPFLVSADSWIEVGMGILLAAVFPAAVHQYLRGLK